MALCHRLKVGLVAAAAAAGVLGGAGLADAAPAHGPAASHGGHGTLRDVGVPGEVDSSAAAIAPDGTRDDHWRYSIETIPPARRARGRTA